MEDIDLTKVKYYPDRFYICLDGFDIENLTTFLSDLSIGEQQSIFIHEYYHYLTNIATFAGIRQFALNFCDRFKATTILAVAKGLDAFPINTNNHQNCAEMVKYWADALELLNDDDIDYNVIQETARSPNKKFSISSIEIIEKPMDVLVDGNVISGGRKFIAISVCGLSSIKSFNLTFGAIDEFLSSAIDEYLFEKDMSDVNPSILSNRPFYPYCFFDELFKFYGIYPASAFEKIIIGYFSLNSPNPPITLINILKKLQNGAYNEFKKNPEDFLMTNFFENSQYENVLNYIKSFADQCFEQGRIHIAQALYYYYDKFYMSQKLKENDYFFFVRPFFVKAEETLRMKQKFSLSLSRIINLFSPPVILKDKQFFYIDKLTSFGESTVLILATYEILESIKTNKIAKRPPNLKAKYNFPDGDPNCDTFELFTPPPIYGTAFRLALNEIGLYGLYLKELEAKKNKDN
ncbi:hypothetical protein MKS83_14450 [Chryseobacterium sp. Y16C]|uniref:hypothetical protein n=1 Tax=Chryseobacterium sp. Y16C TaxID=2920939 RepID=UPI001F0AB434|nr:hypothetical protein [Chryseobacterium sp. Y16C]UMQ40596.1 hypothetical protein MKS83_14450 [Chryseobacterium sp. Y16C]